MGFATYVAIVAQAHPQMVADMLTYLHLMASKFGGSSWLTHDMIFHRNKEGLPPWQDKLSCLEATIAQWRSDTRAPSPKDSVKKQDLFLISLLSHAATVVQPGRPILQSLTDAAASSHELDCYG